jgi:hypothetical protein
LAGHLEADEEGATRAGDRGGVTHARGGGLCQSCKAGGNGRR